MIAILLALVTGAALDECIHYDVGELTDGRRIVRALHWDRAPGEPCEVLAPVCQWMDYDFDGRVGMTDIVDLSVCFGEPTLAPE